MNKNTLNNIIIFAVGAAVGSVVTWKIMKTRYEQLQDEYFEYEETPDSEEEYDNIIKDEGYETIENEEREEEDDMEDKPYVITPEEFGEGEYETESLIYYDDDVLTYENGKVIDNVDEIVGVGSLYTFGQYEDDSVFVRNDKLKKDFEILADERNYYDIK